MKEAVYRSNRSSHISKIFSDTQEIIRAICLAVKTNFPNCGGIISADGLSGSTIVIPVATQLKLPFGFVRNKKSHSRYRVEHHTAIKNVVIIDDLIDSGKTMRGTIKKLLNTNIKPIGIICYTQYHQTDKFDFYRVHNAKVPALSIPVITVDSEDNELDWLNKR